MGNTLSVFDTACLSNRRSADRGLARLKEIGFRSAGAAGSSRLVLDNIVADAVADGAGGVRCFTATPVTDANAFVESVDLLMKKRFKNKVARGQGQRRARLEGDAGRRAALHRGGPRRSAGPGSTGRGDRDPVGAAGLRGVEPGFVAGPGLAPAVQALRCSRR